MSSNIKQLTALRIEADGVERQIAYHEAALTAQHGALKALMEEIKFVETRRDLMEAHGALMEANELKVDEGRPEVTPEEISELNRAIDTLNDGQAQLADTAKSFERQAEEPEQNTEADAGMAAEMVDILKAKETPEIADAPPVETPYPAPSGYWGPHLAALNTGKTS